MMQPELALLKLRYRRGITEQNEDTGGKNYIIGERVDAKGGIREISNH